jgi:hypothetical protein
MLVCDLFHVDCAVTLKRIYVLFVLEVPVGFQKSACAFDLGD